MTVSVITPTRTVLGVTAYGHRADAITSAIIAAIIVIAAAISVRLLTQVNP